MSLCMTKPTKLPVRPAKTQLSLGMHPVWSESSLCTQWVAKNPMFLHADSEDWSVWLVLAGCTNHFVGFVMRRLILNYIIINLVLTFLSIIILPIMLSFCNMESVLSSSVCTPPSVTMLLVTMVISLMSPSGPAPCLPSVSLWNSGRGRMF